MKANLTNRQKKWAESYVKTLNATQACRDAGYSGNADTLAHQGKANLDNPKIQAYIADVLKVDLNAEENNRIATIEEVMEFYTAVMRGGLKDQFGLDTQMSDRIKAAQCLDKILTLARKAELDKKTDGDLVIVQHYGTTADDVSESA